MSSEAVNQQQTRVLHCQVTGGQIWRNNSGAAYDKSGRLIRYGLGHETARKDDDPRSSDLIGITPVLIQPHMVGYYLGVFTAYEVKPAGWHLVPSDLRGIGQGKWHDIVRQSCGFAGFVTNPADIHGIIGR